MSCNKWVLILAPPLSSWMMLGKLLNWIAIVLNQYKDDSDTHLSRPLSLLAIGRIIKHTMPGNKGSQMGKASCSAYLPHGPLVAPFVFQEQGTCHSKGAPSDVVSL